MSDATSPAGYKMNLDSIVSQASQPTDVNTLPDSVSVSSLPEVQEGSSSLADMWASVFDTEDEMLMVRNTFLELCKMADGNSAVDPAKFLTAPASFPFVPEVVRASVSKQCSTPDEPKRDPTPPSVEEVEPTTIMMRNIPTRISSKTLMETCLSYESPVTKLIDFMYLPIDFKTNKNLGYCFVNFKSAELARDFLKRFDKKKYVFCDTSEKQLAISFSNRQGYLNNLTVFTQTKLLDTWPAQYRPLAEHQGGGGRRSVSTASTSSDMSVKNSFIHIGKAARPRTFSAPAATSYDDIAEEANEQDPYSPSIPLADEYGARSVEQSLTDGETTGESCLSSVVSVSPAPPIIQFRGDIFYTVFCSPMCERSPAKFPSDTTTVMVRNIPTRFTSVSFLRILDECGFHACFDFFYLPMDFRTGKNMGYCFLNFVHPNYTVMFSSMFHGRRLRMTTSTKVIEISPSRRQGLVENVALFRASDLLGSLSLPHFKPLVLVGGALRPLSERTFTAVFREHGVSPDYADSLY